MTQKGTLQRFFYPRIVMHSKQIIIVGGQVTYTFLNLNDSIVPTSGFTFLGNASSFYNIAQKEFFQKYFGKLQAYLPLGNKFSLAIRAGAATILSKSWHIK